MPQIIKLPEIAVQAVELAEECWDEGVVGADGNQAGIVHFSEFVGDCFSPIFLAVVLWCGYSETPVQLFDLECEAVKN